MNYLTTSQNQNPIQKVDSTSYIYTQRGKSVSFADYFLSFKFLNSDDQAQFNVESDEHNALVSERTDEQKSLLQFQYTDAVLLILITLFSLIAFVRISGKNYLNRIFSSVGNYSYSNSFFKEKNLAYILNNNLIMIVFFVSSPMMISVIVDYFKFPVQFYNKWQQLLLYFIVILAGVILYKTTYRAFGIAIGYYRVVSEYLFFFSNLLKILGITYVILLFGSFFTSDTGKTIFVYFAILATLLMFFVKLYRILVIFYKNRFSLYYMILYFCALEIIPLILLLKILKLISQNEFSFFDILV